MTLSNLFLFNANFYGIDYIISEVIKVYSNSQKYFRFDLGCLKMSINYNACDGNRKI